MTSCLFSHKTLLESRVLQGGGSNWLPDGCGGSLPWYSCSYVTRLPHRKGLTYVTNKTSKKWWNVVSDTRSEKADDFHLVLSYVTCSVGSSHHGKTLSSPMERSTGWDTEGSLDSQVSERSSDDFQPQASLQMTTTWLTPWQQPHHRHYTPTTHHSSSWVPGLQNSETNQKKMFAVALSCLILREFLLQW